MLGRELCLADVAKVSGQVDCFTLYEAGQQGHIAGFPSTCRQGQAQSIQLLPEVLAAILGLGPAENPTQKGGVKALWWGQPALHLWDSDFVLGGGGQEGEAAGHAAEEVGWSAGCEHDLFSA